MPIFYEEYFASLRDALQENIASNPTSTTCGLCKRLSLLNNFRYEKMFRYNKKICHFKIFEIVFQEKEIGVITAGKSLKHGTVCTINNLGTNRGMFAF